MLKIRPFGLYIYFLVYLIGVHHAEEYLSYTTTAGIMMGGNRAVGGGNP